MLGIAVRLIVIDPLRGIYVVTSTCLEVHFG